MKTLSKYLITFSIGLGVALLIMISKNIFTETDQQQVYQILSDSFFVPGVVITGFGLLVFASNGGAFDMLTFGMKKFFSLFKKDLSGITKETFYDYSMAKHGEHLSFAYMIVVGLILIGISIIFLMLYF